MTGGGKKRGKVVHVGFTVMRLKSEGAEPKESRLSEFEPKPMRLDLARATRSWSISFARFDASSLACFSCAIWFILNTFSSLESISSAVLMLVSELFSRLPNASTSSKANVSCIA